MMYTPLAHPTLPTLNTDQAYVTLVTNDEYAEGAVVLGYSLQESGTSRKKLVLVTKHVSNDARGRLRQHWDDLVEVETLDSNDADALRLLGRPELGLTFTKLFAWQLTDYEKVLKLLFICASYDLDKLVLCIFSSLSLACLSNHVSSLF